MSLTVSIPFSGNLTNTEGLQLRQNRQGKAVLYFKLTVVEDARNGGQPKPHHLSFVVNGKMAENLYYSIQNELVTTRTRLNVVAGLDTYTKPFVDQNGNQVEVQQTSYTVWDIGVSARFAPMADVNSPGFQRLMNGQAQQQSGQFQQGQPQQGGFQQNRSAGYNNLPPQQGGQYQQGGNQQGNYPPQGQAPQQGGYPAQNTGYNAPPQQGGQYQQGGNQQGNYPPQGQAPQQGNGQAHQPQEQLPQQSEPAKDPQSQQRQSMREQPIIDGDDF